MKVQLLPTTFDENFCASAAQHTACLIVDDVVAIDAGSLAMSRSLEQKRKIKDVVLTHAHLDHIAGLPLLIDDLFAELQTPVRVHATHEVVEILENHIFNWHIYPRFSELKNDFGAVMEYQPFDAGEKFTVAHLDLEAVEMNHKVPTVGLIVSDKLKTFAVTSDTAQTENFWSAVNNLPNLDALFIECAFPDTLSELAKSSYHLTPQTLAAELEKLQHTNCRNFIVNIKPAYRDKVVEQVEKLALNNLQIMQTQKIYEI